MSVFICCATITTHLFQNIFITPKILSAPIPIGADSCTPGPLATSDLPLSLWLHLSPASPTQGVSPRVSCAWYRPVAGRSPDSPPGSVCQCFTPCCAGSVPQCGRPQFVYLFIIQPCGGCFCSLAVLNDAAVESHVQLFV